MLLLIVAMVVSSSLFVAPKPAQAQWAVADAPVLAALTGDQAKRSLGDVLVESAVLAVVNGVNYFTTQLAYQAALAVTHDCPGQNACWESKSFGDFVKDTALGAVGEAVGTLTKELFGKVMCSPGKLFSLSLQLGLLQDVKPSPPKCSFADLQAGWDSLKDQLSTKGIADALIPTLQPGQSPVGVSLGVFDRMISYQNQANQQSVMKELMSAAGGGGFISVVDKTSGRVKSPEAVTRGEYDRMVNERDKAPRDENSRATAGSIAKGAVLSVVANTMQTFLMTVMAHLWNKLVNGLLSTQELTEFQPDIILNPEDVLQPLGATGAEQALQSHFVTAPTRDSGTYDPLVDFTSCPSNPSDNNCVMDAQFANAVHLGDVTPLSVREAIKQGMLHGDWPMIPSSLKEKDGDLYCYTYGYCESNLKKLRAARVISIGWEIAAEKSPTSKLVTLGEVVSRFNDCNSSGEIDDSHPWCHLIDPDWVLKAPPAQCRATVPGPYLESSEANTRADECVDTQTCLRQDDLGACTGGWGYCTRERNVWRFQGDQCPAYYNTCRTMKTRTGAVESFLVDTLDHGVCNADNVGCTAYGLALNTANFQNKRFCQAGSNIGKICTSDSQCAGSVCGAISTSYCRGGSNAGATCLTANDCNSKVCGYGCPLDKGCVAGEATGNNGCTVSAGQTTCTVADGTACQLTATCPSGTCQCFLTTCRVPKDGNSCSALTADQQSIADDWRPQPLRYLNKNAQTCDANQNGCTATVLFSPDQSLNLVRNGGFEDADDGDGDGSPDHPQFWTPFGVAPATAYGAVTNDTAVAFSGNAIKVAPSPVSSTTHSAWCALGSVCTGDSCVCTVSGGGNDGFSCLVVKGQTQCYVTDRVIQDGIRMKPNTTYTLSFYARPKTAGDHNGTAILRFTDGNAAGVTLPADSVISNTSFQDTEGSPADFDVQSCGVSSGNLVFTFKTPSKPISTDWVRASCTFVVSTPSITHAALELSAGSTSDYAYIDQVQLEEGSLTPFHEGYGDASSVVDIKVPPPYLACTGDETDRPECASFAGVCRENEVGCERYTPTQSGDTPVPAVVGTQDSCPAECAGYDVFKQEETNFDTTKFPVYFIPSTAQTCGAQQSGCSQFTNVETEKLEYFAGLRLCQKPSTDPETAYYTWEGSDTAGYQLKVWSLKKTTNVDGTKSGLEANSGRCCQNGVCAACSAPLVAAGQSADICADPGTCTDAGVAPCTRLDANAENCASVNTLLPGGSDEGLCSRADIDSGNFDCREFYDANGNRHYRLLSKTIVLTNDCHQYRITTSTKPDCDKSNGQWLVDKGQCVYNADVALSNTCEEAANNCRPYKGNASGSSRTVLTDTFEDGLADWTGPVTQSPESVVVGGHSMKFPASTSTATKELGGIVAAGRSYTLTFWARGGGEMDVSLADGPSDILCDNKATCGDDAGCLCNTPTGLSCTVSKGSSTCNILKKTTVPPALPQSMHFSDPDAATTAPKILLSTDWKQYSLGPIAATDPAFGTASTLFTFLKTGSSEAYVDNITLSEVPESIYVIRDSWNTPLTCDETLDGTPSPQEMLGCKEYSTSQGKIVDLRSFAALCRDKAVGCQAFSNTQNSQSNPYEESYNAVCALHDNSGNPRFCGRCTLNTVCTNPAGCACDQGTWGDTTPVHVACTVAKDSKYCNVDADQGPNCTCDYDVKHAWYTDKTPVVPEMGDVCRVTIGESECRFKYSGWDAATPQATHADRVNIPADDRMYLVADSRMSCDAAAVGCKSVAVPQTTYEKQCDLQDPSGNPVKCDSGAPGWNGSTNTCTCGPIYNATCSVAKGGSSCTVSFEHGITGSWKSTAILDDPAKYDKTLCTEPALACEEFTTQEGTYYFKEPFDHTCQYKEGVQVNGESRFGWFRKSAAGADIPCYPELLKNGEDYDIYKNADNQCQLPAGTVCSSSVTGWDPVSKTCPCTIPPSPTQVCRVYVGDTTCGYQGWAGVCTAQYDRCQEFVDPAATSDVNPAGQPYYYINNDKLDKASCGGEASLRQGCVLFQNTSDPSRIYASFSTYFRSETVFDGGKVAPDNCDLNPRSPDCEHRCFAVAKGACKQPDGTGTQAYCQQDTDCSGGEKCFGTPYFGVGCNKANGDKDCDQTKGEKCLAESDVSADKQGFTKNDSNVILKVRRDRECAEWLACSQSESVWDTQLGKYKNVCTGFDACTEQHKVGDTEECGNWEDRPTNVTDIKRITADLYTQRDTTYKGWDYSGYSIYGKYPAQYVTAVDYTMGLCQDRKTGKVTSGYCWVDGNCSGTDRCGKHLGGFCMSAVIDKPVPGPKPCNTNSDCGSGDTCNLSQQAKQRVGVVLDINKQCAKDSDCPSDAGCSGAYDCASGSQGPGRCIQNICVYDFRGSTLSGERINGPTCRGYPQVDAPFPTSVANSFDDITGQATDVKTAFSGANVCSKDNICDCSYLRVGYGPSGVIENFVSQGAAAAANAPGNYNFYGICTGGPRSGQPCDPVKNASKNADDCVKDEGGQCTPRRKQVIANGWYGFCLDPNFARNINGDPNQYACDLWLPVDQLAGSADLYNMYQEAGYQNNSPVLYCDMAQGVKPEGSQASLKIPTPNPYSLLVVDQQAQAGGGNRGTHDGGHVGGWWYNEHDGFFCDVLSTSCAEVQSNRINYPVLGGQPPIYEDMIGGIHVFFDAGYSRHDVGDGNQGDFYLTKGNKWTFAIQYSTDGLSKPDAKTYYDSADISECPWGVNAEDIDDNCNKKDMMCTRATFDTGHKLTGFDTESCNEDESCGQPSGWDLAKACGIGGLAGCAVAGIADLASNGCPNFLATVYLDLREWCEDVAWVHDPNKTEPTDRMSYPWTDRLFQYNTKAAYGPNPPFDGSHQSTVFVGGNPQPGQDSPLNIAKWPTDVKTYPYGAIPMKIDSGASDMVTKLTFDVHTTADDSKFTGDDNLSTLWNYILPIYYTDGGSYYTQVHVKGGADNPEWITNWGGSSGGIPFSCYGNCADPAFKLPPQWVKQGDDAYAVGASNISQLFAVAWRTYIWKAWDNNRNNNFYSLDDANSAYNPPKAPPYHQWGNVYTKILPAPDQATESFSGWDFREKYVAPANAPKVFAVDFGKCFGSGKACLEGPQGLTVNKVIAQDVVGSGGKLKGIITFYAYADKDHMPIRTLTFDPGDETGGGDAIALSGWYKNHRGSADLGNGTGQSYCDPKYFGGTNDSCVNEYFQETKTYTCAHTQSDPGTGTLPDCGVGQGYPCKTGGACVYKPRVQVIDNWEVCNGNCPGGSGGATCMNGQLGSDCSSPDAGQKQDPWTYFAGTIVVYP